MKGAKVYGIIIAATVIVFMLFEFLAPRSVSWNASLKYYDKKPYGTYIFYHSLKDLFPQSSVQTNRQNYYDLWENDTAFNHTLMIIRPNFYTDKYSMKAILDYIEEGNTVFISSFAFDTYLADTLGIKIGSQYLGSNGDSVRMKLNEYPNVPGFIKYANTTYFNKYKDAHFPYRVLGKNFKVNFIEFKIGEGLLYLHSNPIAFTNFNILKYNTHDYIEHLTSYFPEQDIIWDISLDEQESENRSALRYIHSEEHLNLAYYLLVLLLILYIVFKVKREQRAIPIQDPPLNNSLVLVDSVSQLYLHNKSHKLMADKMIRHLFDYIQNRYFIRSQILNKAFIEKLSRKSGQDIEDIKAMVNLIKKIRNSERISDVEILELNSRIEKFKHDKNTKS